MLISSHYEVKNLFISTHHKYCGKQFTRVNSCTFRNNNNSINFSEANVREIVILIDVIPLESSKAQ